MALKRDAKFEEKLTLGSKNDMSNLINFNAGSGKSENFHFDGLLLSNVMFELNKIQRSGDVKNNFKNGFKNDIRTNDIWWIFTQVVKSNVR